MRARYSPERLATTCILIATLYELCIVLATIYAKEWQGKQETSTYVHQNSLKEIRVRLT
jgi:hypothetical protein